MSVDKKNRNDIISMFIKNTIMNHLSGNEAKEMPLIQVIESFRPYIESKIAGMYVPGMDRDDLRQEAYVALLSAVGSYDETVGSRFSTYAIACINNRFADAVKTASRQKNRILNESVSFSDSKNFTEPFSEDSLEDIAIRNEEYRDVRERIETLLSVKERKVLKLWLRGYEYGEIGDFLGMSPKAVGNALQRAKRKLKK